ncbi:MAG TPA: hypothetical protein VFH80_15555 [Solirubrobacteraceae bacterium]|nr:hypothetical protein [Solirubrobacteraceae bacterium]
MEASGLHAVEQYARAPDVGRPLQLENVSAPIRRLFEITGAIQNPDIELRVGTDGG